MEIDKRYIPEIKLLEMTPEKEDEYASIMPFLFQELDDYEKVSGKEEPLKYMLCQVNGEERLIQFIDKLIVIYYRKGKENVVYSRFIELGDDYSIVRSSYEKCEMFHSNGDLYFRNYQTHMLEDFDYANNGFVDHFGFDSSAVYSQYDEVNDRLLYLVYPLVDRPDGRMYDFHLRKPVKYMFLDHASKVKKDQMSIQKMKSYARYDFNAYDQYPYFTLATIREYGLIKTLQHGPVELQKSDEITRFYRMGRIDHNNNIHISFAFSEQLTEEEMDAKIKQGGFLTSVPNYIIDTYNLSNRDYIEDCCLVEVVRDIDKKYIDQKGFSLVYPGVKNGNC